MKNMNQKAGFWRFLTALVITGGLFILYGCLTDFIYLTNDDMYLQAIVSGEISGSPDAHMIYSSYILGFLLSSLYRLLPGLPWYGLYLTGIFVLCFFLILYRILERTEGMANKIASVIIYALLASMGMFRHIAMLQYTVVAAMAGGTACFYALTMKPDCERSVRISEFSLVLLLAGLCFLIRDKVLFMLAPFAAFGWLGKWIAQPKKTKKINLFFLTLLLEMGIVVILFGSVDFLAYRLSDQSRDSWKEYLLYNRSREQIYDYYGFPDYQRNQEFYHSMGIEEAAYEAAALHYLILPQEAFNAKNMGLLAECAQQEHQMDKDVWVRIKDAVSGFVRRNLDYTDRPLNLIVYAAWLCMILFLFALRSRRLLWQMALTFVARMLVWGVIFFQGRYPDRITQGLYLTELLILAALYLQEEKGQKKECYFYITAFCILCIPAVYFGIPKMRAVIGENAGKLFFGTSYGQLREYCIQNEKNLYLADMNSISSFAAPALQGETKPCKNLLPLGSWVSGSPLTGATLQRYGIRDGQDFYRSQNVYFVFRDSPETEPGYLEAFYEAFPEVLKARCVRVDTLQTDAGIDFGIYRLEVE